MCVYVCVCEREREKLHSKRFREKRESLEVGKIARFLRDGILLDKLQIGYLGVKKGV